MEWRLSLGPGRSARRDVAIALLVFVILIAPVAYLADRLIKRHTRTTADLFSQQADHVIFSIIGRLREYKPLLQHGGAPALPLDRQRYPEVLAVGYVQIARRD